MQDFMNPNVEQGKRPKDSSKMDMMMPMAQMAWAGMPKDKKSKIIMGLAGVTSLLLFGAVDLVIRIVQLLQYIFS